MLLAIETSTRKASVALVGPQGVEDFAALEGEQNHGASLATHVGLMVGDHWAQIKAYGVTLGPGSFTGLRIGMAFLKGLAAVYPRPVAVASSLELIARQVFSFDAHAERVLALLDARQKQVFAALYERSGEGEPHVHDVLPEGLYLVSSLREALDKDAGIVVAGDGARLDEVQEAGWTPASVETWTPTAKTLGELAYRRYRLGQHLDAQVVEPAYHQRSAAEINLGIQSRFS